MPIWEQFCGPSYQSRSRTVSGDLCKNLYVESVESGTGKGKYALYGRPGNSLFSSVNAGGGGQGILEAQGRCFAVAGGNAYEILSNGTASVIGTVGTVDTVSMAANASQLVVTSASGGGWIAPLDNLAAWQQITSYPGGSGFPINCDSITYQDTYFIATAGGTQEFFISAPDDGTTWSPLDFASKEGFGDLIMGVQMVRRQLWVYGTETAEIWWNSGNANFPFQPIQGALVQVGLGAVRSMAIVGNGLFWLGQNSRGKAVAFAEQNFAPIRVSNHAVEATWNRYPTVSDAVGYGYEEDGHTWYVLSFPSANKGLGATWVLDTKTGFWTEWDWWSLTTGTAQAALARFHCFCFGQHLTLDWSVGNVWSQNLETYTDPDFSNPANTGVVRRLRRSPHVDKAMHRVRHARMQLDVELGDVPLGITPIYSMRFSDDGGFRFGNEYIRPIGTTGQYQGTNQVIWRQLGSARDRVYEISSTSPVAHSWCAMYLEDEDSTEKQ